MQDLRSIGTVAERDVLEPDVAPDRRQPRAGGGVRRLRRAVEDVAEPRDRQSRLMKILPDLRETQHRGRHPPREDVEGHELAYCKCVTDHQPGSDIENGGSDDLTDELHQLACRVAEAGATEARRDIPGELLFPAALHLRLHPPWPQRFHGAQASDTEC